MKTKITRRFNKKSFEIVDCEISDWSSVDEYIRPFIKLLNESEHISTIYSCEGHSLNDGAYLYFNVDEIGWEIFWNKVLPELSYEFCQPISIPNYVPDTPGVIPFYQLMWHMNVTDNEYNTGIQMHTQLVNFEHENDNSKILVSWEEKKKRFWNTLERIFMKHY